VDVKHRDGVTAFWGVFVSLRLAKATRGNAVTVSQQKEAPCNFDRGAYCITAVSYTPHVRPRLPQLACIRPKKAPRVRGNTLGSIVL
jgi:hypothetical protein